MNISEADDRFNSVRTEYTGMLKNQIAKSNNGIERAKYVTFCIPAENVAAARPRLERVEADVMGNLKRLGVPSEPVSYTHLLSGWRSGGWQVHLLPSAGSSGRVVLR